MSARDHWFLEPSKVPAKGVGAYGYPMRNIVRIDRSPMNSRILIFQLDCGHDVARAAQQRGRRPRAMECEKCQRA